MTATTFSVFSMCRQAAELGEPSAVCYTEKDRVLLQHMAAADLKFFRDHVLQETWQL